MEIVMVTGRNQTSKRTERTATETIDSTRRTETKGRLRRMHGSCNHLEKMKSIRGVSVYKRMINRKKFQWCQNCNKGLGRWTTTHNTNTHIKKDHRAKGMKQVGSNREVNIGEEFVPSL